jgi:hypothetical protein
VNPDWIIPQWPALRRVKAVSTTRAGGHSTGPWNGLNLGSGCGDDPAAVAKNRAVLRTYLPATPQWLRQVHGAAVFSHSIPAASAGEFVADAQVAFEPGQICVVLTADCLPVLFSNRAGTRVGAAHAGWRGMAAGVLENTVQALGAPPDHLMAWLGPAIGADVYEVGDDVKAAFTDRDSTGAACFRKKGARWLFDLYAMARHRLTRCGVIDISGGSHCTYSEARRFYSHRRDGTTGRTASLVWLQD